MTFTALTTVSVYEEKKCIVKQPGKDNGDYLEPSTLSPNLLQISDFVVSSRLGHQENAETPTAFTLGGMVIETRLEHPQNAESPIAVTLGGMV